MSFIFLILLALELSSLSSLVACQTCRHGSLHHCTCVNVSHTELQCQAEANLQFVYRSLVKETSELRSLQCGPGVEAPGAILESLEASQVTDRSVSVKMVGCNKERFCTPVQPLTFSIETLMREVRDFSISLISFSFFSYTHTKGKVLKDLDLIGCTHLENMESLEKIKNITKAEAINIFNLGGTHRTVKTFRKYIYLPRVRQMEGLNVDLSERFIVKLERNAFWSGVSYQIETLNLSHNSIDSLADGLFPNSTFSTTKYLDLSFNRLSHLQTNVFQNLTSVADLNLAGNRLTVLFDGIFEHNPLEVRQDIYNAIRSDLTQFLSFQRLDLSNNLLATLEANTLRSAWNLESLDLSRNKLKLISLRSDNNFNRLLTLNVAHNSLTALDESWKVGYPILRMLNVSHNSIGPVIYQDDLQFVKTYHGMSLDLSFNKIEIFYIDKTVRKNRKRYDLDLKGKTLLYNIIS